jgi:hypothetical protein
LSGEHFSVDGTLIQAWAGHKSFVRKDGDDDAGSGGDFKGQQRSNDTHESKTDPDSRLYRKGKTASELRYMGHTLTDNRHGLVVNAMVTQADGFAERGAAKAMISDARQAAASADTEVTLGANKGYDAAEFIEALHRMKVTPHVAQNKSGRRSAVADEIAQKRGLCGLAAQAKAHRAGLRLGQVRRPHPAGDGAWHQEGRPTVRADDGRLQPRAHADLGRSPSGGPVEGLREPKTRPRSGKAATQANSERRNHTTAVFSAQDDVGAMGTSAAC